MCFDARSNGFCRYIILRLFHNISLFQFFAQFGFGAFVHSIGVVIVVAVVDVQHFQVEIRRFRWDWKHWITWNRRLSSSINSHQKLIPFHIGWILMCVHALCTVWVCALRGNDDSFSPSLSQCLFSSILFEAIRYFCLLSHIFSVCVFVCMKIGTLLRHWAMRIMSTMYFDFYKPNSMALCLCVNMDFLFHIRYHKHGVNIRHRLCTSYLQTANNATVFNGIFISFVLHSSSLVWRLKTHSQKLLPLFSCWCLYFNETAVYLIWSFAIDWARTPKQILRMQATIHIRSNNKWIKNQT